jgi:hypothetical protein
MSTKKINDKDVFENIIDIGLRMYGNGYSYPRNTIDSITEYCRQQIRYYFLQHNQLITNHRISFLHTLVYTSRHKKSCLKRLQQFLQAKDRPSSQQDELIVKDKKLTSTDRFQRICHELEINNNNQVNELDRQRSRQYTRLDDYYKNETLSTKDYLIFVEQQHTSFNNLRSLSSIDILHWLDLTHFPQSNQELRLAEICLFLIKEILLNLMDKVFSSSIPCQIDDILRRQHVHNTRRLPYSGRKRRIY